MIFKSKISLFFLVISITIILFLTGLTIYTIIFSGNIISILFISILTILVSALLLSLLLNTRYKIDNKLLKYRSGPFFGQIEIDDIRALELNVTKFIGLKMALAGNGIIVKYNKWNEIYLSPRDENTFTQELTKLNPNITVIQKNEQF